MLTEKSDSAGTRDAVWIEDEEAPARRGSQAGASGSIWGNCDGGKPITLLFYRLIISITNAHFLHLRFTVGPSVAILSGLTARESKFARLRGN